MLKTDASGWNVDASQRQFSFFQDLQRMLRQQETPFSCMFAIAHTN
jgi:hypothetical protein